MNVSFEDFWDKLTEDEPWFDFTKMRFSRKDMKSAAQDCYAFLLASKSRWQAQDYQDFRRCYLNFLKNAKDIPVGISLQQQPKQEQPTHTEPILTGKEREDWIKKWMD